MAINVKTSRTTREEVVMELNEADIIALLQHAGHVVPSNAHVAFRVPSGGDYSGMTLDISTANPVVVEWTTTEKETQQ